MTVALSIKVHDGLVIAADSASTIIAANAPGTPLGIVNVYNNANKITNLCKGRPLGAVSWGAGSIGTSSISTLLKDVRRRFAGQDPAHLEWTLTDDNCTIQQVSQRVRQFIFDESYLTAYGTGKQANKPTLGILIGGYSSGHGLPESWLIRINEGECGEPTLVQPQDDIGCFWDGQPEAIHRFLVGYGLGLRDALQQLGVDPTILDGVMSNIQSALYVPMVIQPMPIQDAIDLADFLVHLTIMFSRFSPGVPSVGGPIEIAAITKHEGYKWIKRKHYFEPRLNP